MFRSLFRMRPMLEVAEGGSTMVVESSVREMMSVVVVDLIINEVFFNRLASQ